MKHIWLPLLGLSVLLGACNDTPVGLTDEPARVRIINSTFQTTDSLNPASSAVPRQIDFLFDQSTVAPSALNIPVHSVYPAPSSDPSQNFINLDQGIHEISAHLSAPATPTTSLFSNGANPLDALRIRLFFTGLTNYTIVVSGVAPQIGFPPKSMFVFDGFGSEFPIMDDLSAPARGADGKRMSRFKLINAAPLSSGGTTVGAPLLYLYLTDAGTTPSATDLAPIQPVSRASYRMSHYSSYLSYTHAPAGTYTATIVGTVNGARTILAQDQITLAAGAVYTFVLQSTSYSASPSASTQKLTVLLDAQYSAD